MQVHYRLGILDIKACQKACQKKHENCDLGMVKNVKHVVLQCPYNEGESNNMLKQLKNMGVNSGLYELDHFHDILPVILGKYVVGLSDDHLNKK